MGYKSRHKSSSKKKNEGIKTGTYVTLFNGKQGVVVYSYRSETTIKELEYKDFDSTVSMTTAQAKTLVNKG